MRLWKIQLQWVVRPGKQTIEIIGIMGGGKDRRNKLEFSCPIVIS
jgi:hypothetical protein